MQAAIQRHLDKQYGIGHNYQAGKYLGETIKNTKYSRTKDKNRNAELHAQFLQDTINSPNLDFDVISVRQNKWNKLNAKSVLPFEAIKGKDINRNADARQVLLTLSDGAKKSGGRGIVSSTANRIGRKSKGSGREIRRNQRVEGFDHFLDWAT